MNADPVFRVLFVCTGNRCRSPLAAALLSKHAEGLPLVASSAGVLDIRGAVPPPEAVAAAAPYGVDLSLQRSRSLADVRVSEADLVVGFEHGHVAAAVVEGGASYERSFNLLELLGLLEQARAAGRDAARRARLAVAAAHARRGAREFEPGSYVRDPMGAPVEVHARVAALLDDACRRLTNGLFGTGARADA
jgi:protein-tyrosine phosphatase